MDWKDIKHFKPEEFDSPDEPGSGKRMNLTFVKRLDLLRAGCGFPLRIESGYRTIAHNKAVGGKSGSEHMLGMGCDIAAITNITRYRIIELAIGLNFPRIGIGKTFVHLGMDPALPQDVCWTYYD